MTEEKKIINCPWCGCDYHIRKPRGFFYKNILFFLPVKRYSCGRCLRGFIKLS